MLRHYWKLPDTAVILFELERSHSDGTTRRGGIPPEIWAEVLESPVESILITVVNEKQEPSRRYRRRKQVQSTAKTLTPVSTASTSFRHTLTSDGGEYRGAVRSSRKKHRSNNVLSHGRKGWQKARRRTQGKSFEPE
jgi:hypothetical protein